MQHWYEKEVTTYSYSNLTLLKLSVQRVIALYAMLRCLQVNFQAPCSGCNDYYCDLLDFQACVKCEERCGECEGFPDYCTKKCSDIAIEVVSNQKQETYWNKKLECIYTGDCYGSSKYYPNETIGKCFKCHTSCVGCNGPSDFDCKKCAAFKLYLVRYNRIIY